MPSIIHRTQSLCYPILPHLPLSPTENGGNYASKLIRTGNATACSSIAPSMKAGIKRCFQTSFIIIVWSLSISAGNPFEDEPLSRCIFQFPPPIYLRSLASHHCAGGGAPDREERIGGVRLCFGGRSGGFACLSRPELQGYRREWAVLVTNRRQRSAGRTAHLCALFVQIMPFFRA